MNTKHNSIKHLNMNHTPQRITPRRAKLPLLAAVLILFNIASAWGQTETINSTGEHYLGCGKTYNVNATAEGRYSFINNTGQNITISGIEVRTLRYGNNTYDYVIIKGTAYGRSNVGYGNGNSQRCYNGNADTYWGTVTVNNVTIASGQSATFEIVNNIYDYMKTNCTPAGFEFSITTAPCPCPTLTAPADGAILNSGSSVSFSWEAYAGATSYTLYVNGVVAASNITGTSHTYQATLPDGTHTWKVEANNGSTDCPTRTFTVCSGIQCATNIQPADGTVLTNRLISWDAVECASSYEVFVTPISVPVTQMYAKKDDGVTYKYLVAEPTSTQYHLPILAEGEYRWVVRPKNSAGQVAEGCETHTFKIQYQDADDFAVTPSTQGREFLFSLMQNGYYNNDGTSGNDNNDRYTAIIAPKANATVTFHYYADPTQNQTYTVNAGETKEISMPESLVYHNDVGDQYKNRTVRVTSTADISLYLANEADNSFDASIVLPLSALGQNYMIQTFPNDPYSNGATGEDRSCFMIIADRDNTTVNISGSHSTQIQPSATTVILNEGESYFVRSTNYDYNDLSGLKIDVAINSPEDDCKTIAVFNGNVVTCIPNTLNNNRDHLVEQAYPISNWGTKFAITSTDGYEIGVNNRPDADYIRITAAEDNTKVEVNGSVVNSGLDAEGTYDYTLNRSTGSCFIETDKPVACYLYQRSATSNNTNDEMGDPSMVWIAPIERGIEEITFSTFAADGINDEDHWVNIVIPIEAISGGQAVMLKRPNGTEENIRSSFMTGTDYNYVAGSGNKYAYARVKINHGTYTLRSIGKGKMVIHVYGLGKVRGYAYAAGSEAVPYKSNFLVGDASGGIIDISTLQDPDFHLCSGEGVKYTFMINSNSPNADSVEIDFDDGSPIKKINLTKGEKSVEHSMPNPGAYEITAQVYSTIYNNELCQEEVIVETVRDYVFIFFNEAETIRDTVCMGETYTFTRKYWLPNDAGDMVEHTYTETFENVTEPKTATVTGFSEYGCEMSITFILDVYSEITAGAITANTIECMSDGQNIGLSVVQLQNSVSATSNDPNAHYQWQKSTTESGPWENITNQTGESYIVTEDGYYRRAYIAACSTAYSNVLEAEATGTFNPGTPIDNTVSICANESLPSTTIGNIPGHTETDGNGNIVLIGGGNYVVEFQWQQSTDGGATWNNISGATSYNYTLPTSYTQSTSFRRLITKVGPCTLDLSSGNYHVVVKPTFEYEKTIVKGCPGENNASVEFTITGGSGSYKVYYTETVGNTTVDHPATSLGDGKYIFRNLTNTGSASYSFVIEDEIHGCEKTETITIGTPTALSIGNATAVAGCQGAAITIDIPAISGGTGEGTYRIEVESSVLNINEEVTADPHPATIPGGAAAGTHTVIYKVLDAAGCYKTSTQNVLTIYANPELALSKTNISNCETPNGTITATVTNAPTSSTNYTYIIDPGTSYAGQASYTFDIYRYCKRQPTMYSNRLGYYRG